MKYISFEIINPLNFISAGQFIHSEGWVHSERIIDSFEIIVITEGVLYMEQDGIQYKMTEGNILLLQPGIIHRGWKPCTSDIKFFWFHFLPLNYTVLTENESTDFINMATKVPNFSDLKHCVLPIYSNCVCDSQLEIMLHQLIHISRTPQPLLKNYIMTSIVIQISQNYVRNLEKGVGSSKENRNFTKILEWIRIHSDQKMLLSVIAEKFHYNENYFCKMFSKQTGVHFSDYMTKLRLEKAKDLLYSSTKTVKEIASEVGFSDEKYFMRQFKKYEGLSPSQYRHAFYLTHLNDH